MTTWTRAIERFAAISSTERASADTRLLLWKETLPVISEFRLFGTGLGGFESAFLKYQATDNVFRVEFAHNDYLEYLAELMELPLAWVTSVASFYTMYWKEPKGRWHLQLCRNLPCQLRGAGEIQRAIEQRLGIRDGERTPDGRFSFEEVECLASCGTAPVLQVNNQEYHEGLDVSAALALIERLAGA